MRVGQDLIEVGRKHMNVPRSAVDRRAQRHSGRVVSRRVR